MEAATKIYYYLSYSRLGHKWCSVPSKEVSPATLLLIALYERILEADGLYKLSRTENMDTVSHDVSEESDKKWQRNGIIGITCFILSFL